jgi:trans-AT polyketide synthase/acyltransferase/oxidoreductase domain-containing protein
MKVYGFPGQGSQIRGMGADLFDEFPKEVEQASEILGYSIRDLCITDPDGRLRLTQYAQPALYVVEALAYLRRQRDNAGPPDVLIGHSLGEHVALFAAGVFSFEAGLRLVTERGRLMGACREGGMAAVMGCDHDAITAALGMPAMSGLDLAGHNAPAQFVIAGPQDQLDIARSWFEQQGMQFIPLGVTSPFHSRYMRPAAEEFARYLDDCVLQPPAVTVIANVDARPHSLAGLRQSLTRQIVSTVQWVEVIRWIMLQGDFTFEELGPGRTLSPLVRQIRAANQ